MPYATVPTENNIENLEKVICKIEYNSVYDFIT